MLPWRQRWGQRAEALAAAFLSAHGYVIQQANVRFPVGEIDLIGHERHVLCFVEVRSTSSDQWGGPFASVTDRKRRRIIRAARWYLARLREVPLEIRFDVVGITWQPAGPPSIELIRSAFDASLSNW